MDELKDTPSKSCGPRKVGGQEVFPWMNLRTHVQSHMGPTVMRRANEITQLPKEVRGGRHTFKGLLSTE